jgi:cytochrome oxidase Cu insertion factor (SCO1/SenC/PrrC family)
MFRSLRWLLPALLALASASAAAHWTLTPDLRNVAWIDSDGHALRLAELHAPLLVMTMAYPACRKVCGTTTLVLSEVQARLDAMGIDAEFVIVSYDPGNDSQADWRDYRARRKLDRGNWHFLTGDTAATRQVARNLDLNFWSYHEHIVHDFRILLFDAQWRVVGEVDWDHIDRIDGVLSALPVNTRSARSQP